MGAKSEKREIDGLTFEVQQLPAWAATGMFNRLLKVFGPALAQVAASGAVKGLGSMDLLSIAPVVAGLFERLSEQDQREILEKLLATCLVTVDGTTQALLPQFDLVMQGRILTVFKLAAFAIQVNYRDFQNAAPSLDPRLLAAP